MKYKIIDSYIEHEDEFSGISTCFQERFTNKTIAYIDIEYEDEEGLESFQDDAPDFELISKTNNQAFFEKRIN